MADDSSMDNSRMALSSTYSLKMGFSTMGLSSMRGSGMDMDFSMTEASSKDDPVIYIFHVKIKRAGVARTLELWREQMADIECSELQNDVKYSIFRTKTFRNEDVMNEYTVIQTFVTDAVRKAVTKRPKYKEINQKIFDEWGEDEGNGMADGRSEARYCTWIAGNKM